MSKFTLPPINYDYSSLDKYIDTETMKIHHTRHHQTYIDNLNTFITKTGMYQEDSLLKILLTVKSDAKETQKNLDRARNNAGGHYNHSLFWLVMNSESDVKYISKELSNKIDEDLQGFENMKDLFNDKALEVFGSGWAWLCFNKKDKKLVVCNTPNQDTPMMDDPYLIPFLGLDVWEHAYYLKYQNKRKDYINAWWNCVDWDNVSYFYKYFASKGEFVVVKDDGTVNMDLKD